MPSMSAAMIVLLVLSGSSAAAFELPKEITPAIRSACEKDVRRLCIKKNSNIDTVKACVRAHFGKLNAGCRFRLVSAGLMHGSIFKEK